MLDRSQPQTPKQDPSNQEDLELLERINTGDRNAFRLLYAKYYDRLLRFMTGITGQIDLAQEGINDVMLVVWTNGHSFGGRSKVQTWIMGIAYRKALKLLNASRRWRDRFKSADAADWNELSDRTSEPSSSIESLDALGHALRRLPAKQRAVVELTYRYGYSYEEIAAIVDCPVNTVKTRMFHARATLKRIAPDLLRD